MTTSQLIIEVALLMLIAFLVGCAIGYLLRRATLGAAATTATAPAMAERPERTVVTPPAVETIEPAPVPAAAAIVAEPAPAVDLAPSKRPAKPRAAKPIASAVPPDDAKPAGLNEPRGGKKDDLKQIKGIGPKIEGTLNGLGIYHFDQIATWDRKTVAWVDHHLSFHGRIDREDWVNQAKTKSS